MPITARRPRSCRPRRAHSHWGRSEALERPWLDALAENSNAGGHGTRASKAVQQMCQSND
eukprot:4610156-Prymnesium_polylepis.1